MWLTIVAASGRDGHKPPTGPWLSEELQSVSVHHHHREFSPG